MTSLLFLKEHTSTNTLFLTGIFLSLQNSLIVVELDTVELFKRVEIIGLSGGTVVFDAADVSDYKWHRIIIIIIIYSVQYMIPLHRPLANTNRDIPHFCD